MRFPAAIAGLVLLAAFACGSRESRPARSLGLEKYPSARDLYQLAEKYRVKHGLPALGVGIVHRGRILGLGMAGERTLGSNDWATLDDAFDVASCAKSVTATVAAMLVEQGAIRWDSTVSEILPELAKTIHSGYAGATLELLLSHRAGLNHDMNRNDLWSGWHHRHFEQSPTEQRLQFAKAALQKAPRHAPGTAIYYSSDGYVVAGSMLERAAHMDWEQLVRTRLFQPLGLGTMRYGLASSGGTAPRVSGHEAGWFGRSRAIEPNPAEYGPHPFGAPAGFLHSSVADLLHYVDFHIQGDLGASRLVQRTSFQRLHATLEKQTHPLGWETEVKRDERGTVSEHSVFHGGYSGRFRTNIWFSPEAQWGTVIVTNHGRGDDTITADVFFALLREFGVLPVADAASP